MSARPPGLEPFAGRSVAAGALLLAIAVALGAFGAHALQGQLAPRQLASYQTGVQYQMLHALGLLAVGLVAQATGGGGALRWSARLMLAGVLLFCGSIYLMTAGAPRWLGMLAPLGGLSFMTAWALLAWHAIRAVQGSGST